MKKANIHNREVFRQGLLVLISFVLIIVSVLAWLIYSRTTSGRSSDLDTIGLGETALVLYHLQLDQAGQVVSKTQVQSILIEDFLPGQSEAYELEISNIGAQTRKAAVAFQNVNADFTPANPEIKADIKLAGAIEMEKLTCDEMFQDANLNSGATGVNHSSLLSLYGGEAAEKRDISIADSLLLPPNKAGSLYFTFRMKEDAGNYYQRLALKIDTVTVTVA